MSNTLGLEGLITNRQQFYYDTLFVDTLVSPYVVIPK